MTPTYGELSDEICKGFKDIGRFYENPDAEFLQSANLFLSYQHQIDISTGQIGQVIHLMTRLRNSVDSGWG